MAAGCFALHLDVSSHGLRTGIHAFTMLHCESERRQQLELLEDKLREFRTLGPAQHDDKVRPSAVLAPSQAKMAHQHISVPIFMAAPAQLTVGPCKTRRPLR